MAGPQARKRRPPVVQRNRGIHPHLILRAAGVVAGPLEAEGKVRQQIVVDHAQRDPGDINPEHGLKAIGAAVQYVLEGRRHGCVLRPGLQRLQRTDANPAVQFQNVDQAELRRFQTVPRPDQRQLPVGNGRLRRRHALFAEPIDDPHADDAQPVPDGVATGRPGAAGPA